MSPASLGRSAGLLLLSPSLNPFNEGDPEESAWDKAWRAAVREVLMLRDQEVQFEQEWMQFCEEVEKQQALEDYVNALCSFYGNRHEQS